MNTQDEFDLIYKKIVNENEEEFEEIKSKIEIQSKLRKRLGIINRSYIFPLNYCNTFFINI